MHLPQRLDPSTRDRINAGTLARVHANQIVTFHDSDWLISMIGLPLIPASIVNGDVCISADVRCQSDGACGHTRVAVYDHW